MTTAAQPPASGSPPPPVVGAQHAEAVTGRHRPPAQSVPGTPFGGPDKPIAAPSPKALAGPATPAAGPPRAAASGLGLPGNPALALGSIGPVAIGVPDFFIDTFTIPPFLLAIYQAAGVEYDVPWQVLAAINEVETDYGRNLTVSSAGGEGWMQFLPEAWSRYGVDANGDGVKDPYSPVDAIFGAARFLHAAGAAQNLRAAIFAYANANWYVDSVMLRARLIGGFPRQLVSAITAVSDGRFPVYAPARYTDAASPAAAPRPPAVHSPAARTSSAPGGAVIAGATTIDIDAGAGSPVVAVADGTVEDLGSSPSIGRYLTLRDAAGNTYLYSGLKRLADRYAVPRPVAQTAARVAGGRRPTRDPAPLGPASAGHQAQLAPPAVTASAAVTVWPGPARSAGGQSASARTPYVTGASGRWRGGVELKPLVKGAHVMVGAILGGIGVIAPHQAPHLSFQIRPAGKGAPLIDPKPMLDAWQLLESAAVAGAAAGGPAGGSSAQSPTIGQILLETKAQLQQQVLADSAIDIYRCGRGDIQAGLIDQRVLATLEFLAASGLRPSVTGLRCGHSSATAAVYAPGTLSDPGSGSGVDISAINGIPVSGHQGAGSITDVMIRRLLALQGSYLPDEIISLMKYPAADNTFAVADHGDRVHIGFATPYDPRTPFGQQVSPVLEPRQWLRLTAHLGQIANPSVARQASNAAISDRTGRVPASGRQSPGSSPVAAGASVPAQWQPLQGLTAGASSLDSIVPVR